MGKVLSTAKRTIRNFDLEHRAIKYIEKSAKSEARAAPKHPGTRSSELDEHSMKQLFSNNPQLNERVDQFEIQSRPVKDGILPEGVDYVKESTRKLPQKIYAEDPFPVPHMDFGFVVPETIPAGKLTMRQAVSLVKSYQTNECTIEQLAAMNNLDKQKVQAIVEHFMLFTIPSKEYWVSPLLLPEMTTDQKLLDEPVEDRPFEEPLGGAAHHDRQQTFRGLEYN